MAFLIPRVPKQDRRQSTRVSNNMRTNCENIIKMNGGFGFGVIQPSSNLKRVFIVEI